MKDISEKIYKRISSLLCDWNRYKWHLIIPYFHATSIACLKFRRSCLITLYTACLPIREKNYIKNISRKINPIQFNNLYEPIPFLFFAFGAAICGTGTDPERPSLYA